MQGIQAFESASKFRFYFGVVSTTDMYSLHLYLAGLDDSAGISVINQLLVISLWFLSYWFKFQPISRQFVNLPDHRSYLSIQNLSVDGPKFFINSQL